MILLQVLGVRLQGRSLVFPLALAEVTHVEGKPAAPSLAFCLDDTRVTTGPGAGTRGELLGELQSFAVRSGVLSSR